MQMGSAVAELWRFGPHFEMVGRHCWNGAEVHALEGQALGFWVPGILSSFLVLVVFRDPGELFFNGFFCGMGLSLLVVYIELPLCLS